MEQQLITNGGLQYTPSTAVQYIYLDFDGELTSYNGEILSIDHVTVQNSNLTKERMADIVIALNAKYASSNVVFVTERPTVADYSTICIGHTSAFDEYGTFAGLAETIDEGNQIKSDKAFVMLDSNNTDAEIITTISHETDHLLGTLEHAGEGLDAFACEYFYDQTCTGGLRDQGVRIGNAPSTGCKCQIAPYHYYKDAKNLTIADSGCLEIYAGGLAINTTVSIGGVLYTNAGGTASNTIVYDYFSVHGGLAKDTIVSSANEKYHRGGEMDVGIDFDGAKGFAINTIVDAGTLTVGYGGTVHFTTINSRGKMYIKDHSTARNIIIGSSGTVYISSGGNADDITVNPYGSMSVSSGGIATNIVEQGGAVDVWEDNATVTFVPNVIRRVTLHPRELLTKMTVHSNTIAVDTTINSKCVMELFSKGVACFTTINSGGSLLLLENAIADVTTINSSGRMRIYSDSLACNTTINRGGKMLLVSGGQAQKTIINSSGEMFISSGCTANNTTVNSCGEMYVERYGEAQNTSINSKGYLEIKAKGTANKTYVNSFGSMQACKLAREPWQVVPQFNPEVL